MSITVEKPGAVAARPATRSGRHHHASHADSPVRTDARHPSDRYRHDPADRGSLGALGASSSAPPMPRPSLEERVAILDLDQEAATDAAGRLPLVEGAQAKESPCAA